MGAGGDVPPPAEALSNIAILTHINNEKLVLITRAAAICDLFYISRYFFSHIAIQTCMGYTEIDGRIDGER